MTGAPSGERLAGVTRLAGILWLAAALTLVPAVAGEVAVQSADPLRVIAEESASITSRDADIKPALERASAELAVLRRKKEDLDEMVQRLERRAEFKSLGQELAKTLVEQLRGLPRPGQFEPARSARSRQLAILSDDNIRVERGLDALAYLGEEASWRLATARPPLHGEARERLRPDVLIALAHQEGLLRQLAEGQAKLIAALREVDAAERGLEDSVRNARVRLTQILYWIPAPPSTSTLSQSLPALRWTLSAANWSAAGQALTQEWSRQPLWPALALLAAGALGALRGRLRRSLVALAPSTLGHGRYRIAHALQAIAITFGLAAPLPIVFGTLAALLASSPQDLPFPHALGMAFGVLATFLLPLLAFAWLLDRDGLAVRHFGKDAEGYGYAARMIRRYAWIGVPLIFFAALNGLDFAPFANRQSLGRGAFSLAMIATAVLLAVVLRRRSPFMQRLFSRSPRGLAVGLHALWYPVLVASPLAMGALAAVGYFVVAAFFWRHVVITIFIVLGAAMLYGLMALWVQMQDFRLSRLQDEESRRGAPAIVADGEFADVIAPRLDIASIGEQTRSLLDLLVTMALLVTLWWLWKDAIPMLSTVGDYALWSSTSNIEGRVVAHQVTVNSLLLALVAAAVAAIAMRNTGALLDIVLLQRLDMQADAHYAIKVTARYAIAAVGILLVAGILGIAWNDVQWLVAALGVGLGFGLQEIVANFVSGLIVLAERPIRIGDTITVGGVSGKVASIRARATIIVDADNKEVLIPNKAFITERVVNWSYSDEVTRLLLRFSVPRGSDVIRVQAAVLEAIEAMPDVLAEPRPSVHFTGIRDYQLDLEIRAFVGELDRQLLVQTAINLAVERVLLELDIRAVSPQPGVSVPEPQRYPSATDPQPPVQTA